MTGGRLVGFALALLGLCSTACTSSSSLTPGRSPYPLEIHQSGHLRPFQAGQPIDDLSAAVACVPAAREKAEQYQQLGAMSDVLGHVSWVSAVAGLFTSIAAHEFLPGPFGDVTQDGERDANIMFYGVLGGGLALTTLTSHLFARSQSRADMLDAVNMYNDLAPDFAACGLDASTDTPVAPEKNGAVAPRKDGEVAPAPEWAELLRKPVVVLTVRGSAVVGTLIAVTDELVVVRSEDGEIVVPTADIRKILLQRTR